MEGHLEDLLFICHETFPISFYFFVIILYVHVIFLVFKIFQNHPLMVFWLMLFCHLEVFLIFLLINLLLSQAFQGLFRQMDLSQLLKQRLYKHLITKGWFFHTLFLQLSSLELHRTSRYSLFLLNLSFFVDILIFMIYSVNSI